MKNQYVGDIGDYGKYGLLRHFAKQGVKIGINWYLTENDESRDGRFISYLKKTTERYYDPELFDALKKIAFIPDKSVVMVEEADLIPDALYYHEPLNTSSVPAGSRKINRRLWHNNARLLLRDAELVFLDPDNGMIGKKNVRSKDSEKYVLPSEVADYYNAGQNVVYYCHRGRRNQEAWEKVKLEMKEHLRDARIVVLTYHRGTQRSYIFVIHPDDCDRYLTILAAFDRTFWRDLFMREAVDGVILGRENMNSPFEVRLDDGSTLVITEKANGTIWVTSSRKQNVSMMFTPEQLAAYFQL